MKRELSELFLGLGFARISAKRRKQLWTLLLVSLALHLVGGLIFAGYVVMRGQQLEKPVFVASAPVKTYEPRKLEHRVKVQKKQRSSSRPSMVPRLVSLRPSDLALPKIDLNPKLIRTSFQPKFKAVSGVGLGVGTGTGFGLGGFGGGISNFNFFGIKGSGDRIAILMDVSVSMVEDERDGFAGFMRVKSRINEVVEKLDAAAFFNVIAFADAAESWQSQMVSANEDNKQAAKAFVNRFNQDKGNCGLRSGNVMASDLGLPATGGTTRLDLALTAAFQNGADTILVISDGLPQVEKGMSAQEEADYARKLADWQKRNAKAIANAETVEKKVWVPGYDGKLREGGPKGPKREGHFEMRSVRVGMPRGQPKPPKPEYWTLPDFLKHLEALHKALYAKKGRKLPVVHCIGYQIDSDGGRFLRKVAHTYKGNYRKVNRIR
jgi:hypothetical protein